MYLIIFGAPGVGKGTQAKLISRDFEIPQVSTGDMLREAIRNETELGNEAKAIMARGELVPDHLILNLIRARISKPDCEHGLILDGFPRTIIQAQELSELMKEINLPAFTCIEITAPKDVIIERITSRMTCNQCGTDYNKTTNPAPEDMVCTICGGNITTRHDDNEATVRNRLKVYCEQTDPVKHYYADRGNFFTVDGNKTVDDVYNQLNKIIKELD